MRPALALAALAACGPTWHADVAPIVDASCVPCHATGGAATPLDTWEAARAAAPAMLDAMASGRMPAGNLDRSGDCGTFTGHVPPSDADLDTIARWLDAGTPRGAAVDAPPPAAAFPADVALPLPLAAEQRCVLTDPLDAGVLRGYRVAAAPGAVHHAMVFTVGDPAAAEAADAADPGPGWACPTTPGIADTTLAAVWTPGAPAVTFPDGTGVLLPGGPLVVQIHAGSTTGEATLELALAPSVDRALSFVPIAAPGFVLPPGEAAITWTETRPLASAGLDVLGVSPHMHTRGLGLTLSTPDRCLADAPRWDYAWQEIAFTDAPVPLAEATPLTLSCTFDTRGATGPVTWGETTADEMCTVFLLAAPR